MENDPFADKVFLTQTDTTIGFVSRNAQRLDQIKKRPSHKHYIKALPSLQSLNSLTRVPEKHKNRVRRARKSTFIFPDGSSYRIIRESMHLQLIKKLGWAYTTSANPGGKPFEKKFAEESADIIVGFPSKRGRAKGDSAKRDRESASKIFRLSNTTIKRLR